MEAAADISDLACRPRACDAQAAGAHWLVYDGQCSFCRAWVRLLAAIDWLGRIRPMDLHTQAVEVAARVPGLTRGQMMEAMRLITPRGEVYAGFLALRRVAGLLPMMWAALPLLYLPGMSRVGPAVYGWIARHRSRSFRCSPAGVCRLQVSAKPRDEVHR